MVFLPELPDDILPRQIQIPRAQQLRAAVAHLQLQLVQVAEMGGVVARVAVAADVLRPGARQAVPAGLLPHRAPVAQPLRRADALWGRGLCCAQQLQCRAQQRHGAGSACLAVLRGDVDPLARQIHIGPGEPLHLVRANPCIEHQPYGGQTNAALVLPRGLYQLLRFLRRQNRHRLFHHARGFHPRHRVLAAPAALHRRGKHPAERQPRLYTEQRKS